MRILSCLLIGLLALGMGGCTAKKSPPADKVENEAGKAGEEGTKAAEKNAEEAKKKAED